MKHVLNRRATKRLLRRKISLAKPLLIFCGIYLIYFNILENTDFAYYFVPYSPLDDIIPFVPYFIVPYLLWFIFVPLVMATLLFTEEELYQKTSLLLIIGMSAFLIISTLFPTRLYLRPAITGNENIFCHLIKILYSGDTPTNVFPSIHVYNTCVVLGAVYQSRKGVLTREGVRIGSTILSILIIMATVFLKQHSIMDVLAAGILYATARYFVERYEIRQGTRVGSWHGIFSERVTPTHIKSHSSVYNKSNSASTEIDRMSPRVKNPAHYPKTGKPSYEHFRFHQELPNDKTFHSIHSTERLQNQQRGKDENPERYRSML